MAARQPDVSILRGGHALARRCPPCVQEGLNRKVASGREPVIDVATFVWHRSLTFMV
jgi:hypothetical protein